MGGGGQLHMSQNYPFWIIYLMNSTNTCEICLAPSWLTFTVNNSRTREFLLARTVITLLKRDTNKGDMVENLQPITMLNTEFK